MSALQPKGSRRTSATGVSEDTPSRSALLDATLVGVRWVTLARLVSELVSFGAVVWLAHLVAPAEFGRAAIALIVNALAVTTATAGFGVPLVQRASVERRHLESAQLASLACGAALTTLTFVLAPLICDPLFGSETRALVQLMSPVFVVASLGVVSQAILQRRLDFRRLSMIEIGSVLAAGGVSVGLANAGFGAEAIVLGALAATATIALLQQLSTPLVLPRWHRRALGEVVGFGLPAAASSLADVAHRNVDYAILGGKLPAAQVGFYWRAFQVGVDHQRKISGILMRIALPVYSRAVDDEHRRRIRARMVRVQTAVIFPLLAIFIAVAPTLIPWMFGERWEPSVVPAQILAVAGMAVCVLTGLGPLMLAAGHPRALLAFNVASCAGLGVTVLVAAPFGLIVVCVAVTAFYFIQVAAAHWFLLGRLLGIRMGQVFADIAPSGVGSLGTVAAALPLARLLEGSALHPVIQLLATAAVALVVYVVLLRVAFPPAWGDLMLVGDRVLSRRRPGRTPAATAAAG
jgi:lipopolysaccharide exporter